MGDIYIDWEINIYDVILIINYVLADGCPDATVCNDEFCEDENQIANMDLNQSGGDIDILDIIELIQLILGTGDARYTDTGIQIFKDFSGLQLDTEGDVVIELTISHDDDFEYSLSDNAFLSDAITKENVTRIIIIHPENGYILNTEYPFEVIEINAASGDGYIDVHFEVLPMEYKLNNIYPNPFNPITNIEFTMPVRSDMVIQVYDLQGREVVTLLDNIQEAGVHSVIWNAENESSGIYFIRMTSGSYSEMKKVMLLK